MVDNKSNQEENQLATGEVPANVDLTPVYKADSDKPPDKINKASERPQPIFETVPDPGSSKPEDLRPEEVSADVVNPKDALTSSPPEAFSPPPPPFEHKTKLLFIGGVAVFFLIIFFIIIKLFFGGKAQPKEINLQYWGLWEEKEVLEPLIAQYQAKNPNVKIVYQKMSPQQYREKLIARGKNGQGPDIFRFHNTWLPQIKEIVTPLPSNIMSSTEFEKTFYAIHASDLGIGEKAGRRYYGLPLEIDGLVLVYNEGLFKKAGINKAPVTWEEITEYVSKLAVKDKNGQIINSPIALGTASNVENFSDIFGLMLIQNGGDLKNLDKPEAAGALESYRKLSEPPTDFWNDSMPNSMAAFIQEKVAMVIVPSWEILTINIANPDLKFRVVGVPQIPGAKPVSLASYWVEGVSRYSRNQVEAWKFLRFLVEKDNLTKLYTQQSKNRIFGEPYSRKDLGPTIIQNEYIGAVIQQAESYVSLPLISRTYDAGINDEISKYIENAINATLQGTSYAEALRVAAQGVAQVYGRFNN
ncbi:MAG: extracellular solute-binding protein [Candidatus Roizmanbacteria bacterium]|nr:MAG: extracellular solute-binding protein [Candidatus Roizmanbacteria bacterium]